MRKTKTIGGNRGFVPYRPGNYRPFVPNSGPAVAVEGEEEGVRECVCVCVCMYVCTYVCMYMRVFTYVYVCVRTCVCGVCMRVYVCLSACMCVLRCTELEIPCPLF